MPEARGADGRGEEIEESKGEERIMKNIKRNIVQFDFLYSTGHNIPVPFYQDSETVALFAHLNI